MKFREVLLVAVLVLAGFALFQFKTGRWDLDDIDWGDDFGIVRQEVTAEETRTIVAPPPAIEVVNGHGWVEIRGLDQDFVQLTFKKVVWRRKEADALEVADQIKYSLTTAADKLTLGTNREEFRRKNFETAFVLTVPRSMAVRVTNGYGLVRIEGVKEATVRNRHGEVYASDIDGPCVLETSYEDVETGDIRGACQIVNSHGDVRALNVGGDLEARTSYARIRVEDIGGRADLGGNSTDVEARRVAGPVAVDASYEKVLLDDVGPARVIGHNMAVTAGTVRGDLEVRTSYEPVRIADVEGQLTVDAHNASVTAAGIGGPTISLRTSYENVSLADFAADLTIVSRNGNITLQPRDLKRAMDVRDEHGRIEFFWPAGEKARLEARAKGGSVSWGLNDGPDVNETNGVSVVKAYSSESSAPLVYLSTSYDDIRIVEAPRKF
jgi:DUF4097 and DUF4098 domain-containing protein YvlB